MSAHCLKLSEDQQNVGRTFYKMLQELTKAPWIASLFFLLTFGLSYTLVVRSRVRRFRLEISELLEELIKAYPDFDERECMEVHQTMEEIIIRLESITKRSRDFYVFRPLHIQYRYMLGDFRRAERTLFAHLYPNYNIELSAEEEKELVEAFKPWQEDSQKILTHG